ncbi:preprotein translocase subunit YajC [Antrihabitans cavernicola]|uniref:Preprotein translocase subunit YajC n=1 Tax=Antrihabitans cavernicola TaxID=2495913 RepID=A0A5A7SE39_9NOCA|nr:preprotein translocase subunit YajC [Spelaeibacter cavernicola]KAA0023472.1 preprotein translocase subunit YajC [Spelaeibacter cavernicola]
MELLFPLLIVALLVPMFLGVRRQKKELARTTELQESLKVGDRVLTTSGLYGTIVEIDDTTVDLEIAEDVITTWSRAVVRERVADDHFEDADDTTADDATATDVADQHVVEKTDVAPEETAADTERRLNKE